MNQDYLQDSIQKLSILKSEVCNNKIISKSYSPISYVFQQNYFDLLIKEYKQTELFPQGGVLSQAICSRNENDYLQIIGPKGKLSYIQKGVFYFSEIQKMKAFNKISLIAGGTGIAPLYNIIIHMLLENNENLKMNLLFSNKTEKDILLKKELDFFSACYPHFSVQYYIQSTTQEQTFNIHRGLINTEQIQKYTFKPQKDHLVIVCGSKEMGKTMKQQLKEIGFQIENIFCYGIPNFVDQLNINNNMQTMNQAPKLNDEDDKENIQNRLEDSTQQHTPKCGINLKYLEQNLLNITKKQRQKFRIIKCQDEFCQLSCSAEATIDILETIKKNLEQIFQTENQNFLNRLFPQIYTLSNDVYKYCNYLKITYFQKFTLEYLEYMCRLMKKNDLLCSAKYLEQILKFDLEIVSILESQNEIEQALKYFEGVQKMIQDLKQKSTEKKLDSFEEAYKNYERLANIYINKYLIVLKKTQKGQIQKQLDGSFSDKSSRVQVLIDSILLCQQNLQINREYYEDLKKEILDFFVDYVKEDSQHLCNLLQQKRQSLFEPYQQQIAELQQTEQNDQKANKKQQQNKQPATKETFDIEKTIKEKSENFNINQHVEFTTLLFEQKDTKNFQLFYDQAMQRLQNFNLERQFLQEINFLISKTPNPTPPEEYQIINIDINQAFLVDEIDRVRNQQKKFTLEEKVQKESKKYTTDLGMEYTEEELHQTEHRFVYIIYKKTMDSSKTIIDLHLTMENEYKGPIEFLKNNYQVVQVPINQYRGVQATYQTVPFLCIKHVDTQSQNSLAKKEHDWNRGVNKSHFLQPIIYENYQKQQQEKIQLQESSNNQDLQPEVEEEKEKTEEEIQIQKAQKIQEIEQQMKDMQKTLNMDDDYVNSQINKFIEYLKPILSNSFHVRSQFEYQQLPLELRQVPKEFINLENKTYLYFFYRQQTNYYYNIKLLKLLKSYVDFEESFDQNKKKQQKSPQDVCKVMLDFYFEEQTFHSFLNEFQNFVNTFKNKQDFQQLYFDLTYKIGLDFWTKYIKPFLVQYEFFQFSIFNETIANQQQDSFALFLNEKALQLFTQALLILIDLCELHNQQSDIVLESSISLFLSKILELSENYVQAYQILKTVNKKINIYRDWKASNYFQKNQEYLLPLSVTCNNLKIHQCFEQMKDNLKLYQQQVCASISQQCRQNKDNNILNDAQQKIEKFENDIFFKELLNQNDDMKSLFKQIQTKKHSEYEQLITNIQCEILYCLSRCFLMIPFEINDNKRTSFSQVPTSFYKLMNYKNQSSQKQVLTNTLTLKNSLQEVKEIPKDKLKFQKNEKNLLKIAANNKYLRAIFMSTIAITRDDVQQQQKLLRQSLGTLDEQSKYEQNLLNLAIQNSQYLLKYSTSNENRENPQHPLLKCLVEGVTEVERKNPKSPVILKFNRKSITLCFPFYKPKISQKIAFENPEQKVATYISIRGAMVDNSNVVGLNSCDLSKTGELMVPDRMVKIDSLTPNKKYQFALLGFDSKKETINGLGELSPVVYTILPMPLTNLYAHIGKCAFLLRNYKISIEAFNRNISNILEQKFCQTQNFVQIAQNYQFYKINRKNLSYYSLPEITVLSETAYLLAQAIYFNYYEKVKKSLKQCPFFRLQLKILQIVELLIVSSELSILSKYYQITTLSIISAYNYLELFLKYDNLPFQILNILLKIHNNLSMLPSQYMNDQLSIIANKVYYYLINASFQNRKSILILKSICTDLNISKKYFQIYPILDKQSNILNFQISDLQNFDIQSKFFEYFQLVNPKLQNQIEYYEEQIQKNLQNYEDVEEKQKILLNMRSLKDFFDFYQDQKTTLQNILKRFENVELLNYLLKYIQMQIQNEQEVEFSLIEQSFTKFDEYQKIQQIMQTKELLVEKDIQWSNMEIYKKQIDLDTIKKEDISANLEVFLQKQQLLQQYDTQVQYDQRNSYIYGQFENESFKYLAYYLFLKTQYKTREFYQNNKNFSLKKDQNANIFLLYCFEEKQFSNEIDSHQQDQKSHQLDEKQIEQLEIIFYDVYQCMVYCYLSKEIDILKNCIIFCLNFMQKMNITSRQIINQKMRHYLLLINEISFDVYKLLHIRNMSQKSTEDNISLSNVDYTDLLQNSNSKQESLIYSDEQQFWSNLFVLNLQINKKLDNPYFILYLSKKYFESSKQKKSVRLIKYLVSICKFENERIEEMIKQEESNTSNIDQEIEQVKNKQMNVKKQQEDESLISSGTDQESESFLELQSLENRQKLLQHNKKIQDQYIDVLKQTSNYLMNEQEQYQNMHSQMNLQIAKNDILFAQVLEKIKNLYNNEKFYQNADQQNQSYSKEIIYQIKNDVIEIQKKKNSYNNLVISLNTLGEFYYKLKDKDMAEENWREALDSVFQKLNVLEHIDEVFNKMPFEQDFVLKYNARSLHITIILCYRLSEYIYYNNLEKQRQCLQLVNNVVFYLLSGSLPHPLSLEDFRSYKLQTNIFPNVFQNPIIIKTNEFVKALDFFAQLNHVYQNNLQNLPIYCYLQYISEFQTYSIYENLMARYGQIFSLAKSGFINESIQNYRDLCSMKYMPQFYGTQNVFKKQKQGYFAIEDYEQYNNDLTPYDERNKIPLKGLADIDETKILQSLKNQRIELLLMFKALKPIIYKCIYRNENLEMNQYTKQRENALENNLNQIKKIQKDLQILDLIFGLLDFLKILSKENPNFVPLQDLISNLLQQQDILNKDLTLTQNFYYNLYQTPNYKPVFCQMYFFLSIKIQDFYKLLNYQLENLDHLGKSLITYTKLIESKEINKQLIEQCLQNNNIQQKQGKNQNQLDVQSVVFEIQKKYSNFVEQNRPKFCVNILNCIYLKHLIARQLYYTKNYRMLEKFFLNIYQQCEQNKEFFFQNICKGIEARFQFEQCNMQQSLQIFRECEKYVSQQNISHPEYALILGDYAGVLVSQNEHENNFKFSQKKPFEKQKRSKNINMEKINEACQIYKKVIKMLKKVTTGIMTNSKDTNEFINKFVMRELGENQSKIDSIFKTNDHSLANKQKSQKPNGDKTTKKNQDIIQPKTQKLLNKQIHAFTNQFQASHLDEKDVQHNYTKLSTLIYCENQKFLMLSIIKYLHYKIQLYDYEYQNRQTINANLEFYIDKLQILKKQIDYIHCIYSKNYFIRNLHKGHAEFLKSKLNFLIIIYKYLKEQQLNVQQIEEERGKSFNQQGLFISQRQIKMFPSLYLYLKQNFLPQLQTVKENLIHSLKFLKEEKVNIQIDFNVCDIYNILLEVNRLLYQYTQPFDFKFLRFKYMDFITKKLNVDFNQELLTQFTQKKVKEYINFEKRIVNENFKYVEKINQFYKAKKNLKLKFFEIELSKDFEKQYQEKLTKDVQIEIQQQKKYTAQKNSTTINTLQTNEIELLNYFKQLDRETFFTFFNYNYFQQQIKIHKFLLENTYYQKNFMVEETEIDLKANINAEEKIEDGAFLFLTNELHNCQIIKIDYMLSKSDSSSSQKQSETQLEKAVQIKEITAKQQYYQGLFYTSRTELWQLKQQIDNMCICFTKDTHKRDLEKEREDFYEMIMSFAEMMLTKENDSLFVKTRDKITKFLIQNQEQFFPCQENLDIIKNILDFGGTIRFNDFFLMMFRKIHKIKIENGIIN